VEAPENGVGTRLILIPVGIGIALIAVGGWMYAFPGAICSSAGLLPPSSSCPVPSSYYQLPDTLLATGAVAIVLGLFIRFTPFLRVRRAATR
jgi:hypothetical protein